MRESLAQKARGVICFGHDCARCIDKFIKSDLELSRRENVVCVRGKTESDRKKFIDPESSSRSHAGEVRVHMINPHFLQAEANIDGLVEPKKIRAAPPFIEGADNFSAQPLFSLSASNFIQQCLLLRKIMHSFDDSPVPVLCRLVFRVPD